jgi:GNAT superfamily N-acetyltransferase
VTGEFYRATWLAVEQGGDSAAGRLRALVEAATDPAIIRPASAAVWYGFMGEAKARRDYQEICAHHDDQFHFLMVQLCREVSETADPPIEPNHETIAQALSGLIDLAWQSMLYDSEGFDCQQARLQCLSFLSMVFPWVFPRKDGPEEHRREFGRSQADVIFREAVPADIEALAVLVNLYRVNEGAASDEAATSAWLDAHMSSPHERMLVAEDPGGRLRAFAHTVASACPLELCRYRLIRALYVDGDMRRGGIGKALIDHARDWSRRQGEARLEIEMSSDNSVLRELLLSLGAREEKGKARFLL